MSSSLGLPKRSKSSFLDNGFKRLKKVPDRFHDHNGMVMHKEAVLKSAAAKSATAGIDA